MCGSSATDAPAAAVVVVLDVVCVYLAAEQGSGKTRSLLIGINYVGSDAQLSGCHNDAIMMKEYIATHVSCHT